MLTIPIEHSTLKREIGNKPGPDLVNFNSSDNLNYQESINKQNYSVSHISCSCVIGVKNSSVTVLCNVRN